MKKKIIISAVILLIIIAFAIPKIIQMQSKGQDVAEVRTFQPLNVRALVIKPQFYDYNIFASGSILNNEEVQLRAEISGRVVKINFKEGQRVSKGTLLLKVNDADLQAQLKKAESRLKIAQDNESRLKRLLEIEGVSRENYDLALNEVVAYQSEIDLLKAQIEKTEIIAPFNGIIGFRYISEGAYITPQTEIATLYNNNPVKIQFSIPQKYADLISVNSDILFKLPTADKNYTARIYAIEPQINTTTRTLDIRGITPNNSGELIPGSFVEIDFPVSRNREVFMVPTAAIVPDLSSPIIYVYRDGKAMATNVETGIRTSEEIEILSGLNAGDTVIVSGIISLRQGLEVNINELK